MNIIIDVYITIWIESLNPNSKGMIMGTHRQIKRYHNCIQLLF